jgi:hypothetical protein
MANDEDSKKKGSNQKNNIDLQKKKLGKMFFF